MAARFDTVSLVSLVTKRAVIAARLVTLVTKRTVVTKRAATRLLCGYAVFLSQCQ